MQPLPSLFADYAAYHQTKGNKAFHRVGIPLIVLSSIGMLARITIWRSGHWYVDAAMVLIALAEVYYLTLSPLLGVAMLAVTAGFYFLGSWMPMWLNVTLFVLGWILQFVGHSVYEKKQPAFFKNVTHLLIGPLWILNDLVPVVKR